MGFFFKFKKYIISALIFLYDLFALQQVKLFFY